MNTQAISIIRMEGNSVAIKTTTEANHEDVMESISSTFAMIDRHGELDEEDYFGYVFVDYQSDLVLENLISELK